MAKSKRKKRTFQGMSYHQVQRYNSENRLQLNREQQQELKKNGYKNIGWEKVIALYQKIKDFLDKNKFDDWSLEDLFLEADRIGNKYQSPEEIQQFNQELAQEVSKISEEVDKQFPDTEMEVIDFSKEQKNSFKRKPNQKSYRTIKI